MRVCARSAICGIRKCTKKISDKLSFQEHVQTCHKNISFPESTDYPATRCTWKMCEHRFHFAENFAAHFNSEHLKEMNIRARPIKVRRTRKIKKKRTNQCETCYRKFVCRNDVLYHHLRCHKDVRPVDQDELWPEVQMMEPEEKEK